MTSREEYRRRCREERGQDPLMNLDEAAALLGYPDKKSLYPLIRRGKFKAKKISGRIRIYESEVLRELRRLPKEAY